MNTYKTLKQINENPIYAPIGCEEEFKRRIFLDNVQRALTIRTFQKTAGVVIRKKLNTHPTAKIISKTFFKGLDLRSYYNLFAGGHLRRHMTPVAKKICQWYDDETCDFKKSLYIQPYIKRSWLSTKKGKVIKTRVKRFVEVANNYFRVDLTHNYHYVNDRFFYERDNAYLRMGFMKFMDIYKNYILTGSQECGNEYFMNGYFGYANIEHNLVWLREHNSFLINVGCAFQ